MIWITKYGADSLVHNCVAREMDIEVDLEYYNPSLPYPRLFLEDMMGSRYISILFCRRVSLALEFAASWRWLDSSARDGYPQPTAAEKTLSAALKQAYQTVTRYLPPYCSTVTIHRDSIGFFAPFHMYNRFNKTLISLEAGKIEHQSTTCCMDTHLQETSQLSNLPCE